MNRLRIWRDQIIDTWNRMSWNQRLSLSFEGVIALATIFYVIVALLQRSTMSNQLSAMKASNELTKESLVSVQRAFVEFNEYSIEKEVLFNTMPNLGVILDVLSNWENVGTTPAVSDLTP